jgi:hypothetical protein
MQSLSKRVEQLEAAEPWQEMNKSPHAWPVLSWLLESGEEVMLLACVFAEHHADDDLKRLLREIAPARIQGTSRQMPTEVQLSWACEYIRAALPIFKLEEWYQRKLAQWNQANG